MLHRDEVILLKILSEINIALEMIKDVTFEFFNSDEILKRAACMTVINIGELVKSLSVEFRQTNSQIPWKSIAGFRDIAAHKYQTLHMEDVYHTIISDFPVLENNIKSISVRVIFNYLLTSGLSVRSRR